MGAPACILTPHLPTDSTGLTGNGQLLGCEWVAGRPAAGDRGERKRMTSLQCNCLTRTHFSCIIIVVGWFARSGFCSWDAAEIQASCGVFFCVEQADPAPPRH